MGAGSFRGPAAVASASAIVTLYSSVQSSLRGHSAWTLEVALELLLCDAPCRQARASCPRDSRPQLSLHRASCGETRKIPKTSSRLLLSLNLADLLLFARQSEYFSKNRLYLSTPPLDSIYIVPNTLCCHPPASHVPRAVFGFPSCTEQRFTYTFPRRRLCSLSFG